MRARTPTGMCPVMLGDRVALGVCLGLNRPQGAVVVLGNEVDTGLVFASSDQATLSTARRASARGQ